MTSRRRDLYLQIAVSSGFVAALVVIWQVVAWADMFEKSLFPSPLGIVDAFRVWIENGGLVKGLEVSLRRIVIGYAFCVVLGIPLGLLIGRVRLADWTLGTLVRLIQPIPGIAWVPLAVVWFLSVSETAKIFIVVTGGLFPVVLAASSGVRQVPPAYIRAARTMGVKGIWLFTRVIFPASVPSIVTGMRISWAFCWRALVAVEIVLAVRIGPGQEGLGGIIGVARQFSLIDVAGMVMVVLAVTGLLIDGIVFNTIEHRVRARRGLL